VQEIAGGLYSRANKCEDAKDVLFGRSCFFNGKFTDKRINVTKTPMSCEVDVEVDATGLRCPEPLMIVRNRIMDMQSGQVIKIIATDPSTSWDFVNYCKFLKHELLHQEQDEREFRYWIRKA